MIIAYTIDTGDEGRWLYLYCPVCAAVYQVGLFEDPSCPNTAYRDHDDERDPEQGSDR